jgi:hypothetical protein
VWALLVVVLPPSFDFPPRIAETGEPVRVQTFVAQSAIEAFDVGILHGLASKLVSIPAIPDWKVVANRENPRLGTRCEVMYAVE